MLWEFFNMLGPRYQAVSNCFTKVYISEQTLGDARNDTYDQFKDFSTLYHEFVCHVEHYSVELDA